MCRNNALPFLNTAKSAVTSLGFFYLGIKGCTVQASASERVIILPSSYTLLPVLKVWAGLGNLGGSVGECVLPDSARGPDPSLSLSPLPLSVSPLPPFSPLTVALLLFPLGC